MTFGNTLIGKNKNGELGMWIYRTEDQYLYRAIRTKRGKLRSLSGKRLANFAKDFADFRDERNGVLSEAHEESK